MQIQKVQLLYLLVPQDGFDYAIRIKMQKQEQLLLLLLKKDGKLYSASKLVKVTIGGCGG